MKQGTGISASVGAILSSVATMSCCLPIGFAAALGAGAASGFFTTLRPWLLGLSIALLALGLFDRQRGNGELWQAVMIGLAGGLIAAVAYDVFRLPFVFAKAWGISSIVPPMNLFKVFPRFGAMVLGQPLEQDHYSLLTQVVGWLYHFSNGATFGVMYVAMVGNPTRRHWLWAVLMALALELGMLLTPYPHVFGIAVTPRFVLVTIAAHAIFGVGLGLTVRNLSRSLADRPGSLQAAQSPA